MSPVLQGRKKAQIFVTGTGRVSDPYRYSFDTDSDPAF